MTVRIAAALSAAVLASAAINTASADVPTTLIFSPTADRSVTLGGTVADGSEIVTVTVNAECSGVQSWVAELDYDSSALEFAGVESAVFDGIAASAKNDKVTLNCYEFADVTCSGEAFTVSFKVKKDTIPQSCIFTLRPSDDADNFFAYDDSTVSCSVIGEQVSVELKEKKTGSSLLTANVSLMGEEGAPGVSLLVNDENGDPVAGAKSFGTVTQLRTLPDGEYTLIASKDGYAPRSYTVTADGSDLLIDITLCKYGDLDGSGTVDMLDLALLRQLLAGWEVSPSYENTADVNTDGKVDMLDLALLQQWLAGWEVTLGDNN